jgi:hypothetical protein
MGNSKQELTKQKQIGRKVADESTAESGTPPKRGPRAGRGGERLRSALDKLVDKQSEQIAQALVDQAIGGSIPGFNALAGMIGAKNPRIKPPKRRRGMSEAQQLEAEAPWEGPEEGEEDVSPRSHETPA